MNNPSSLLREEKGGYALVVFFCFLYVLYIYTHEESILEI